MTYHLCRREIVSIGIFLFLLLSSCGLMKKEQVNQTARQVDQSLAAGDFQKAIDLCNEAYHQRPKDAGLLSHYVKTIEYIKDYGDRGFKKKDFPVAKSAYDLLLKNYNQFKNFAHLLSFDRTFLETRIRTSRNVLIEKQAQPYLLAGDFQKAIDTYKEHYQRYPQDPLLRGNYIKTLESIKSTADRSFEKNDFRLAGCIYHILLKNFSSSKNLNRSLSFNRESLDKGIEICRNNLFESALVQYRSGDLNKAIALWRSILAFDPENREVKKAVETATVQSKNIEMKK